MVRVREQEPSTIATAVSEFAPLRDVLPWSRMGVFDPWAGGGSCAHALTPWGALCVTGDIDPRHGSHLCGDALESEVYHTAWSLLAEASPTRVKCIVTSPWFGLLDLALPYMMLHAPIVCAQVPHGYLVNGPRPRQEWLHRLSSQGRVHVVVGMHARNPVVGRRAIWLLLFASQAARAVYLSPECYPHCATFEWVP